MARVAGSVGGCDGSEVRKTGRRRRGVGRGASVGRQPDRSWAGHRSAAVTDDGRVRGPAAPGMGGRGAAATAIRPGPAISLRS
jgi:hypothetical protein